MIVQQLIQLTPIALVWLSGLILAITRWQRHPQVSLWIVVSLAAMIVANAGQLALLMALQGANSWTLYLVRAWNPLLSTLG
jgi:L-cystine uptake protein TcyP (sodium:dicarboxylate symporter family)